MAAVSAACVAGSALESSSATCAPIQSVKVAQADFAYVNDGSLEKLDDFVQAVLRELMP